MIEKENLLEETAAGEVINDYAYEYDSRNNRSGRSSEDITKGYNMAELANAAWIEYLYNGQYGIITDCNGLYDMQHWI